MTPHTAASKFGRHNRSGGQLAILWTRNCTPHIALSQSRRFAKFRSNPQQEVRSCVFRDERSERLDPTYPQERGLGRSWGLQRRFLSNRARYMRSIPLLPRRQLEV